METASTKTAATVAKGKRSVWNSSGASNDR
jgi:hypothetical protein